MPNKDKEKYNKYMNEYMKKRAKEKRLWALQKLGNKCVRCGSSDDLDIDHIDPSTKSFTFAKLWSKKSEIIERELNKCQLLCKQCHHNKSLLDRNLNTRHEHGTYASYRYRACRCALCIEACRIHNALYRRAIHIISYPE